MSTRALIPPGSEMSASLIKVSPGLVAGRTVYLSGITGSLADGTMPLSATDQFRRAFEKIGEVLAQAGLTHRAIVEITSYHIGLRHHFDDFNAIRCEYIHAPYPAWTAVEVAGLRREGALVEIRVVASMDT